MKRLLFALLTCAIAFAPLGGVGPRTVYAATCAKEYIVKSGDWVRKIAREQKVEWQEIVRLNKLAAPDFIYPGQKLCLQETGATATPTPTKSSTAKPPATVVPIIIPTIRIVSVVKGESVTIETSNFPAGVKFEVRMGAYGTAGVGGTLVTTTDSAKGGTFQAKYTIPAGLKTLDQIAIRLESASTGYFAFNWFYNNTAP
jgi:hypothetical protein